MKKILNLVKKRNINLQLNLFIHKYLCTKFQSKSMVHIILCSIFLMEIIKYCVILNKYYET